MFFVASDKSSARRCYPKWDCCVVGAGRGTDGNFMTTKGKVARCTFGAAFSRAFRDVFNLVRLLWQPVMYWKGSCLPGCVYY